MADPVLPGNIRVQAVLVGHSGLPEDRYITTWAFSSDVAGTDSGKAAAIAKVRNFFTVVNTSGVAPMSYLAGATINEAGSFLRAYDLGQPVNERVPYQEAFTGLSVAQSNAALPSEVALCLSYYAGLNRPGLRGRIYFGPLASNVLNNVSDAPARPQTVALNTLREAADNMASTTTFPRWCIISKGFPTGIVQSRIITAGWIDNAYDTQRRRGETANVRQTWSALS